MLNKGKSRRGLLVAVLLLFPQFALSQDLLDSYVFSEQGSLLEAGSVELLSVGGQAAIGDISQDAVGLQLGYLHTLTLISKPIAAITSPAGEGICSVVNGNVTVMGTVESTNLNNYRLESAPGLNASSGFVFLSSGAASISGVLAAWPTTALSGFQTLRLTATDASGGSMISSLQIFVGQPAATLTLEGLNKPEGAASGTDGKIYIADRQNDRIVVFASTGGALVGLGGFNKPSGVAVDGAGNIYVADTNNDRVLKLAADGSVLLAFGQPDKKKDPFKKPQGVAVDTGGRVYVADTGNDRVKVFGADGAPILVVTLPDGGKPTAVAVDAAGRIYVADEKRDLVLQYAPSGLLLKTYGAGILKKPSGLAVDADGDCLFVSDSGHGRIVRFDRFGNFQAAFSGFNKPTGLALTATGELLVADRNNDRLLKLAVPNSAPLVLAGRRSGHGPDLNGIRTTAATESFGLREVYAFPNPAGPGQKPTIRVQVGQADTVEINIYDVSGRPIEHFGNSSPRTVDDGQGQELAYDFSWDTSRIGSGVYIYAVTAKKAGQVDIRSVGKVAVIK